MALFQRKAPTHLIPVSPENAISKDWVILLEAGTIVGPSPEKLRVARSTMDKKVVKKVYPPTESEVLPECGGI